MLELNRIYNMDCLEGMKQIPDGSVDAIITDPPYIISVDTGFKSSCSNEKMKKKYDISYRFGEWDDKQTIDMNSLMSEYYRILKNGGTLVIFYDKWKMQDLKTISTSVGFKQHRLCLWCKTNPVPINSKINYLSNAQEFFMTCVKKSSPTFNSEYDNGIYYVPICHGKERTKHTTQKPIALMDSIVNKHTNCGDLVLDTFIGSGTTAVSCVNNGRNFIGFELDEDYFKIAEQRINEALNKKEKELF